MVKKEDGHEQTAPISSPVIKRTAKMAAIVLMSAALFSSSFDFSATRSYFTSEDESSPVTVVFEGEEENNAFTQMDFRRGHNWGGTGSSSEGNTSTEDSGGGSGDSEGNSETGGDQVSGGENDSGGDNDSGVSDNNGNTASGGSDSSDGSDSSQGSDTSGGSKDAGGNDSGGNKGNSDGGSGSKNSNRSGRWQRFRR